MGETAGVAISISDLIGELNYSSDGRGEEAKFELISRGVEVIPELAARVPGLERLGKLLAIDAFETLGDPRACSSLIALLRDDDATVVEWSARALGSLGCREAVGPLVELRSRLVAARVPPDWTGPVVLRRALSDLGARQAVVPVVTANLKVQRADLGMQFFRSADLTTVIEDLAGLSQVILYFQVWRIGDDGRLYWVQGDREEWAFDWSAPWSDNVAAAHAVARANAARLVPEPDLLVQPEWIDEEDLSVSR
jgi:PBS lyase HEAT-like repeat-containing protein